ncbi:right-handed parallel beta-helix repeat-containing protein [Crateriforma conspicua]|uniref:right-handed parallel beta-helix repeat-containing protein n=1 Tax=Crateriforma conspicua TaxID=2527996 RepID=UPI0013FCFF3D|nr:right-handed parallel beta-helix repeat-containing protein [Crateriforma conspicua]
MLAQLDARFVFGRIASMVILSCLLIGVHCAAAEFHVRADAASGGDGSAEAPFRTIQQACDSIAAMPTLQRQRQGVTVWIGGGIHRIDSPIRLGAEHSGALDHPVRFAAMPGEQPVISGGVPIGSQAGQSWRRHDDKRWVVDLPKRADGSPWRFRQLYVNGQRRYRARTPDEGFYRVAACPEGTPKSVHYHTDCKTFQFHPGDLRSDWKNLQDVEVIVYHFWTDSHLPIATIDDQTNTVTFAHRAGKVFTNDFSEEGARYVVENVFEALDQPGEWYLDSTQQRLYYYPHADEDMTKANVVAPLASQMVVIDGDVQSQRFAEHIRLEGLTFRYCCFDFPPGNSNDQQGSASIPAAVEFNAAHDCVLDHCRFHDLGTFAIDIKDGCVGNQVTHCDFSDLSAGGIRIGGGDEKAPPWYRTENNVVSDNRLVGYGIDFPSAVGILLTDTSGNRVAHNEISGGEYTGVSVGWTWGYGRSISRDNQIEDNHIHDIGGMLSDLGGIYTLGVSPGTVLRGNHIHDIDANGYGGWGIYHDEGSTHILVENNLVHDTKFSAFNIHFAKEVTVRNNIFALGELEQLSRSRVEPHVSVYFENNIVYWTEGKLFSKNWSDQEYSFYLHPKNSSGTAQRTETSVFDWNLYFNPNATANDALWDGGSLAQWQQRGKDRNGAFADPGFADPKNGDFTMSPTSPALKLGFRPWDVSTAGPRGDVGPPVIDATDDQR